MPWVSSSTSATWIQSLESASELINEMRTIAHLRLQLRAWKLRTRKRILVKIFWHLFRAKQMLSNYVEVELKSINYVHYGCVVCQILPASWKVMGRYSMPESRFPHFLPNYVDSIDDGLRQMRKLSGEEMTLMLWFCGSTSISRLTDIAAAERMDALVCDGHA